MAAFLPPHHPFPPRNGLHLPSRAGEAGGAAGGAWIPLTSTGILQERSLGGA